LLKARTIDERVNGSQYAPGEILGSSQVSQQAGSHNGAVGVDQARAALLAGEIADFGTLLATAAVRDVSLSHPDSSGLNFVSSARISIPI
jgi:hypothetical protein